MSLKSINRKAKFHYQNKNGHLLLEALIALGIIAFFATYIIEGQSNQIDNYQKQEQAVSQYEGLHQEVIYQLIEAKKQTEFNLPNNIIYTHKETGENLVITLEAMEELP